MVQARHIRTLGHLAGLIGVLLLLVLAPAGIGGAVVHEHGSGHAMSVIGHAVPAGPTAAVVTGQADCASTDISCPLQNGNGCCTTLGCHLAPFGTLADSPPQDIWPLSSILSPAARTAVPAGIGALPLVPPPRSGA